ncbi:NADH-quinone oxidoreductase subunit NuoN [Aestuariispira insulae]|uniref:NADH-quinone oxidoreductase subunit N n=1 Tax=Aestuariispira insulae TaxID=1461337 RepID=A0A3D9HV30_9PROT|nr:NADH-quinone oxidoreductase subunit NuoN [Aestuariispira insulae]RED53317.1 NADH dehydrogenase subunit N [Aestuariispira insulae]
MIETHDFITVLPELILAIAAMVMMMVGAYSPKDKALGRVTGLALITPILAIAGVLFVGGGTEARIAMSGLFVVDSFGVFMKLLVLVASFLAILMSDGYIRRENMARFEYPILITFATLGMLAMISANDLMSLYIGLELQSLSLYVLAAMQRDSIRSTEAGLKYFVLGAVSSGMLLYGCSMIYGFTGTTNYSELAGYLTGAEPASVGLVIGLVFLLAGLAFKVSAVPFHMWTPDVYEGAPTPVTAFFAVAPKIAAMALFLRTMIGPFGGVIADWQQIIFFISVASMALGALAAINQTNIKRLMAYSSIGHIGYALIGLATGTEIGVKAVLMYLAIYLFMNVGTFAIILSMKVQGRMVENISDLAGLHKNRPFMAILLMIFMFSMAGIPPLAGFLGKFFIFDAAVKAGLIWLAVIGAIASVISAFYYIRIIKVMYFEDAVEVMDPVGSKRMGLILVVTGVVTATMIGWFPAVSNPAAQAAASLFAG